MVLELNASDDRGKQMHAAIFTSAVAILIVTEHLSGLFDNLSFFFTGINVVRGQILNFASTRTIFNSGFKLVILDEADAMTNDAQNALRRIIEKFTDNVRFCLICNYLSKIIPALQSR